MKEKNEELKKRLSKMSNGYGPMQRFTDLLKQVSDLYKKEMATVDMAEGLTFKHFSSDYRSVFKVDDEYNNLFILELSITYHPENSVTINFKERLDGKAQTETISIDTFANELDDLKYWTRFLRRFEQIMAAPLYHRYPEKTNGSDKEPLKHEWEVKKARSSKPLIQTVDVSNDCIGLMNRFKNDLVKWIVGGVVVNALFNIVFHYYG